MSGSSKYIKIVAYLLAVAIILGICSLIYNFVMLFVPVNNKIEVKEYSKTFKNVKELDIELSSSSLTIEEGDIFKIEARDLPAKIKVSNDDGKVKIKMNKSYFNINTGNIVITVPKKLDYLLLRAGAGNIDISDIVVKKVRIELGAGSSRFDNVEFKNAKINGGAGNLEINDSKLTDAKIDAGVGKIDISAYLYGDSDIECGIGKTSITLLGDEDMYSLGIEKGLGTILLDGKEYSGDVNYGKGENKIEIEGGIGEISVRFRKDRRRKE